LDNFDDRYLGAKASDPSLDNDGNALAIGALYFNTTDGVMKVYTASGWIAASSASVATLATFEFVATSGQTVFTGNDANGSSLSYVAPAIIVTLNGVRLRPGDDYTATNGTSITLVSAAALNDELVVDAFGSFLVANTVDLSTNQTIGGTKTFSNPITASAGTVSAPGITTTGDSNTGIFFPAADTIAFAEGGAEVIRIDSSGNLLVGGTNSNPLGNGGTFKNLLVYSGSGYAAFQGITTETTTGSTACAFSSGTTGASGSKNLASINIEIDGTSTTNGVGRLAFYTSTGGNTLERMRIDSQGRVTIPYQPSFCAHDDGSSAYGSNSTVVFNTVKHNIGSHYSNSTGRFTAPIAGRYFFYAQLLGDSSGSRAISYLAHNGSTSAGGLTVEMSAVTTEYNSVQATAVINLAAGDYVSIITSGSDNRFYSGSSFQNIFCGHLLG